MTEEVHKEFFLAEADDFEQEVAALRASQSFQKFLDERTGAHQTIPLEDIEAAIEAACEQLKA